jgi:hypothetical protein
MPINTFQLKTMDGVLHSLVWHLGLHRDLLLGERTGTGKEVRKRRGTGKVERPHGRIRNNVTGETHDRYLDAAA